MPDTAQAIALDAPIMELRGVSRTYHTASGPLKALKPTSIQVARGETLAIVGESGSGKSTLGRIALGLETSDSGSVHYDGRDVSALSAEDFRIARRVVQPVFQDATASLNPRRKLIDLIRQASSDFTGDIATYATELLNGVGLSPGEAYLNRQPHELSGGQRQRFAIARALAMEPHLIVADEALSGADVSIRGQILNLFLDIQEARNLSYLMITHDIAVARAFAHRAVVMQKGEIVEEGIASEILTEPQHPYTQRLLAAVPKF